MTEIGLHGVSKYFGGGEIVANYELDLEIADGEFVVILGPSGCGKTTALRLVAGLETPSTGEITFDGVVVNDRSPSNRNVAMVFQNYALYPHMNVRENVAYPLKVRGIGREERDRRIAEMTGMLHIDDLLEKRPAELSGGQRQRVALARAIVREPAVFLLDEPLSNLDAKLRQEMRSELKRIQDEIGITTIYVTHNQEEAMSMGDRVVVMNEGTIRQVDPPEELYRRPRTTWVANFIGSPPMNLLGGRRRNGGVELAGENYLPIETAVPSEELFVGVRPEDMGVDGDGGYRLEGIVDTVEPLGEYMLINVDVGDERITAKVGHTDAQRGDRIELTFAEESTYVYDDSGELVT